MKSEHEKFDDKGRPLAIKIGPHVFDIVWLDAIQENSYGKFGQIQFNYQRINISAEHKSVKIAETFIHECLHGIHWDRNVYLGEVKAEMNDEEFITDIGATGLTQLWQDNPSTMEWWRGMVNA